MSLTISELNDLNQNSLKLKCHEMNELENYNTLDSCCYLPPLQKWVCAIAAAACRPLKLN